MGRTREIIADITKKGRMIGLALSGFTRESAKTLFLLESLPIDKGKVAADFPDKRLLAMLPFDSKIDALFSDSFSPWLVFWEDRDLLPKPFFLFLQRDGERFVLPIADCENQASGSVCCDSGDAMTRVMNLMKERGGARILPLRVCSGKKKHVVRYESGFFSLDGAPVTDSGIASFLRGLQGEYLVSEFVDESTLYQVAFSNGDCGEARFLGASKLCCGGGGSCFVGIHGAEFLDADDLVNTGDIDPLWLCRLKEIATKVKSLEFCCFRFAVGPAGLRIVQVDAGLDILFARETSVELQRFIASRLSVAKTRVSFNKIKSASVRAFWRSVASRHGFVWFMYRNWVKDRFEDLLHTNLPLRDKVWAHGHGFFSYRIAQYGLDDNNVGHMLSDRDYRYLRPLNNGFRKWVEDKISIRYVLGQHSACLPKYFFHIARRWEGNRVIPLPDCPKEFCCLGDDGVIDLLKHEGKLALKPVTGSHGEGFHKLESIAGDEFFLDGVGCSSDGLKMLLSSLSIDYIVTEYVEMHHELQKLFSEAACTVRLMVINQTGVSPEIVNAYYRIGTSSTGFTDNVAFGGVYAYVDIESGYYHDAEMLVNHRIASCPVHPDTGVDIEGYLPNWEMVKEGVRRVCEYLSPLEYLGVDVVITESGFTILEINTHQDLHRYPTYSAETQAYFGEKVALKRAGKQLA